MNYYIIKKVEFDGKHLPKMRIGKRPRSPTHRRDHN